MNSQYDLKSIELEPTINTLERENRITRFDDTNILPSILYTGTDVAVVWQKYQSGTYGKIYFAF